MALLLGGNNTDWKKWNEKQAGGILSFRRSENQSTEQERQLHKNTGHAYSQDVLSFMLGREGKSIHRGIKKERKQQKMEKKSNKDTSGESRV